MCYKTQDKIYSVNHWSNGWRIPEHDQLCDDAPHLKPVNFNGYCQDKV